MQRVTVSLSDSEHDQLVQAAALGTRSVSQEIRHRLFPPTASQAAPDVRLSRTERRDGEDPVPRKVRPISRRESAR